MGKLEDFSITITNPEGICRAGEMVRGYVTVVLNRQMRMGGIQLKVRGESKLSLDQTAERDHTQYSAKEFYLDEIIPLLLPGKNKADLNLDAGSHQYEFQCRLPSSVPTTFEGDFGFVRYSIECWIEKPWHWKQDYTTKVYFSVVQSLDLNLEEHIEEPFSDEDIYEDMCCACFDNGEIVASLDLPRTGYVPGEDIPVSAEIGNQTSDLVTITIRLTQKATYSYPEAGTSKSSKRVISEVPDFEINGRSKCIVNEEKIRIPSVAPSRLMGCNLINLDYAIKLKVSDESGVCCKVTAPIIIGTVPLRSVCKRKSLTVEEKIEATQTVDTERAPNGKLLSHRFPLPVCEDGMFGSVAVKEKGEGTHSHPAMIYTPKYLVYKL